MIEVILRLTEVNVDDRRRATERQELLIAELNHRVRNVLALIRGLVSQTGGGASDVASYVASLNGRVQALARAHDQATSQNWGPSEIASLFDNEIAALGKAAQFIKVEGHPVLLQPQAISTLALVVHELVTNSLKHGALSSGGKVAVTVESIAGKGVNVRWRERGGPAVQAPTRRGFGSVVIERTVPFDLEGTAEVRYLLAGFEADFFIPERHVVNLESISNLLNKKDAADSVEPGNIVLSESEKPLNGLNVLLLEDNMIIAMEAEYFLTELGAKLVVTTATVDAAEAATSKQQFDFAMLDINVGARTSFDFAVELKLGGVPFVFASGYGDRVPLDGAISSAIVVQKPYDLSHLAAAVAKTLLIAQSDA